jgi:hypothetical protein
VANLSTDVLIKVRMDFQASSDARKITEGIKAIQKTIEQAEKQFLGRLRSAQKRHVDSQLAEIKRVEKAYIDSLRRVEAAYNTFYRKTGKGFGAGQGGGGGRRGGGAPVPPGAVDVGGGLIVPAAVAQGGGGGLQRAGGFGRFIDRGGPIVPERGMMAGGGFGGGGMIPDDPNRIRGVYGNARGQRRIGGPVAIEVEALAKEIKNATATAAQATAQAKAAAGGGAGGAAAASRGFFGGGMENKFLSIASATITAFNAPKVVLGGVSELIRDLAAGGEETFVKPGKEFYSAVNEALPRGGMGEMLFNAMGPAGTGLMRLVRTVGEEEQRNQENARNTPRAREERFGSVQQSRLDNERNLNQIILERTKAERDLIEETRKRIDAAREEFGLMDVREKQATLDIARKVAGPGGVGQLTSEELKFARGNVAFRGILSEQAQAGADAAGFAEIVKLLGLDRKIAEAEAKISADIKQTISVDLDPSRLADALEERIAPLVKELEEITINRIRAQMNAQANEAAQLRRQGVAP